MHDCIIDSLLSQWAVTSTAARGGRDVGGGRGECRVNVGEGGSSGTADGGGDSVVDVDGACRGVGGRVGPPNLLSSSLCTTHER